MTDDHWIAPALIVNPSTPVELLLEMVGSSDDKLAEGLCRHRPRGRMPSAVIEALASHPNHRVRMSVIERADTPLDVVARLADDPARGVRMIIAARCEAVIGPLDVYVPEAVYEKLARDPERHVRAEILASHDVPERIKLLVAEDPELRDHALLQFGDADASHQAFLRMLADDNDPVRVLALRDSRHVPPAELTVALLNDPSQEVRFAAIRRCPLTHEQATILASGHDPRARATVAGNPSLPYDLRRRLAHDPDDSVRLAVVLHFPDIPIDLLDEIAPPVARYERVGSVGWLWDRQDDLDLLRRYARSRSIPHRRTIATIPNLPADVIELLAADDDFAVKLLLTERHPDDVPLTLLIEMVRTWDGYSGTVMARNPRLPADTIDELSRSDDVRHRWQAVHSGRLTPEQHRRLANDPDEQLAHYVNPPVPDPNRLAETITNGTCAEKQAAAAHPALPVKIMWQLWRRIAPPGSTTD